MILMMLRPLILLSILVFAGMMIFGRKTRLYQGFHQGCSRLLTLWGALICAIVLVRAAIALVRWAFGKRVDQQAIGATVGAGVLVALVVGFLLFHVVRSFLRFYDRDVAAVLKRADEGDLDGAIADLRTLIDAKGPSAKRLNGLGVLYLRRESFGEALKAFEEATRLSGRDAIFLNHQGMTLRKLGRAGEALEVFNEAIAKEPSSFPAHLNRSHALIDLGRLDEARADLDRAAELRRQQIPIGSKVTREENARQMDQWLDECRARLAAGSHEKKGDLAGLDEL